MEEIREALQPLALEFLKFLAVVVSVLLINILTILRNSVKDSFIKRKVLNWAINKAIKMEGEAFKDFTNEKKWERLVYHAERVGIKEKDLLRFEAEIMGAVEEYLNYGGDK